MKYLSFLIGCSFLLFTKNFCFSAVSIWSKVDDIAIASSKVEFWGRGVSWANTSVVCAKGACAYKDAMTKDLQKIFSSDELKDRLPKELGVLIDAEWKKTAGYWAADLKTPSGLLAVLVTPQVFTNPSERLRMLSHEFTHLAHYKINPKEEGWVREGLAMLVEHQVTGFLNPVLLAAKELPETSLTESHDPGAPDYVKQEANRAQYGHVLEYFYYLYRLCGAERFIEAVFNQAETSGVSTIDAALTIATANVTIAPRECSDFKTSFTAFSKARFMQSTSKPANYVWLTSLRAKIRDSANDLPHPFPRYSSGAYRLKPGVKDCEKGDHAWGEERCIRVRF